MVSICEYTVSNKGGLPVTVMTVGDCGGYASTPYILWGQLPPLPGSAAYAAVSCQFGNNCVVTGSGFTHIVMAGPMQYKQMLCRCIATQVTHSTFKLPYR